MSKKPTKCIYNIVRNEWVNDTYDLIICESQNKDERTGNNPCPLDPMQVENKKEDLAELIG